MKLHSIPVLGAGHLPNTAVFPPLCVILTECDSKTKTSGVFINSFLIFHHKFEAIL
jgi:hypothetical protein